MECQLCKGTGWVIVEKNGVECARRCSCQESDFPIQQLINANIPRRFIGATLENFHESSENLKKAKSKVRNFIEQYPGVSKGLLISGPTGVGKTRLLCTIAGELLKRGFSDLFFLDWNELVMAIRSAASQGMEDELTREDIVERACGCELLLFDEFFASLFETHWMREMLLEAINFILIKRYNNLKITVFATNLPLKASGGEQNTLADTAGARLFSRISEMAEFIEINSFDFRKKYG